MRALWKARDKLLGSFPHHFGERPVLTLGDLCLENIELMIDREVLDFMVKKALEYKLGARGLRSICESILTDAMFELPGTGTKKLHVTADYAEQMFGKSKLSTLKVA